MIDFRLVTELYYDEVVAMVKALYQETAEHDDEILITTEKILNTLHRTITHPDEVQCYLFFYHQKLVGYGLLCSFWSNEYGGKVLIVDELYVQLPFRGKGIVTQFISMIACFKQYVMLDLEVFPTNIKAQNLYKRMGFTITNRVFMNKFI